MKMFKKEQKRGNFIESLRPSARCVWANEKRNDLSDSSRPPPRSSSRTWHRSTRPSAFHTGWAAHRYDVARFAIRHVRIARTRRPVDRRWVTSVSTVRRLEPHVCMDADRTNVWWCCGVARASGRRESVLGRRTSQTTTRMVAPRYVMNVLLVREDVFLIL